MNMKAFKELTRAEQTKIVLKVLATLVVTFGSVGLVLTYIAYGALYFASNGVNLVLVFSSAFVMMAYSFSCEGEGVRSCGA